MCYRVPLGPQDLWEYLEVSGIRILAADCLGTVDLHELDLFVLHIQCMLGWIEIW